MRRLIELVTTLAIAAAVVPTGAAAHHWTPGACGLPTALPLSIDFAEVSVSPTVRREVFGPARPPLILASSGATVPPELRAAGHHTVFWDMNLRRSVGTPSVPADPAAVEGLADRLYARAAASTGCSTPAVALNELFGGRTPTPWSTTNAQYRANTLLLLRRLHAHGAHPYLLVTTTPAPYTASPEAAQWWRDVAAVSDVVLQLHFNAPYILRQGPFRAGRLRRAKMRRVLAQFEAIGVPAARLGLLHGFQSGRGAGGREGLPLADWLRVVKWEVLATKQVVAEREASVSQIGSDWSWGWGDFPALSRVDPHKHITACVYLWVRNPTACDGPGRAAAHGARFNTSLLEGQIVLEAGAHCVLGRQGVSTETVVRFARVTGDAPVGEVGPKLAVAALFQRLVEGTPVSEEEVVAAEQQVIAARFGGDAAAYAAALALRGADVTLARHVLADQLRRRTLEARLGSRTAYLRWTRARQRAALARTTCIRDELPAVGVADLSAFLSFLKLV